MGSGTRTITTESNSTASLYLLTQGDITLNSAGANDIVLQTNTVERWRINSTGLLRSSGAQTITFGNTGTINTASGTMSLSGSSGLVLSSTSGGVTIGTGSNGDIDLVPNGTGIVETFANTSVPKLFLKDVPTTESSPSNITDVLVRDSSTGEIKRSLRGQKIEFTPTFVSPPSFALPAALTDQQGFYAVNGDVVTLIIKIDFTNPDPGGVSVATQASSYNFPVEIAYGGWPIPSANLAFGNVHIIASVDDIFGPIALDITDAYISKIETNGRIQIFKSGDGTFKFVDALHWSFAPNYRFSIRYNITYIR